MFRDGVTGNVECDLGLETLEGLNDTEEEEEGFSHEERGVLSFPADVLSSV